MIASFELKCKGKDNSEINSTPCLHDPKAKIAWYAKGRRDTKKVLHCLCLISLCLLSIHCLTVITSDVLCITIHLVNIWPKRWPGE